MNPKFLAVAVSTALLAACGGDDNKNSNKSPLAELGIQCASVEKAAASSATGTLQTKAMDANIFIPPRNRTVMQQIISGMATIILLVLSTRML